MVRPNQSLEIRLKLRLVIVQMRCFLVTILMDNLGMSNRLRYVMFQTWKSHALVFKEMTDNPVNIMDCLEIHTYIRQPTKKIKQDPLV